MNKMMYWFYDYAWYVFSCAILGFFGGVISRMVDLTLTECLLYFIPVLVATVAMRMIDDGRLRRMTQ